MGQELDDGDIYAHARQKAEAILPALTSPTLVNDHAILGVTNGEQQDWGWWTSHIREVDGSHKATALEAIETVLAALETAELAVVDAMPEIVGRLVPFVAEADPSALQPKLTMATRAIPWDGSADAPTRRAANHRIVNSLSQLLPSEFVADTLVADIMDGVQQSRADVLRAELLKLASTLTPGPAAALDTELKKYAAADSETAFVLLLRCTARLRCSASAIASGTVIDELTDPSAPRIVTAWLALKPTVEEAIAVLHHAQPAPASLQSYAIQLSQQDRSSLWVALERDHAALPLLQAAASAGVDSSAVSDIRTRLLAAPRQPERDALAERLRTLPLREGTLRVVACELALELLATAIAGNAALAARLVLDAGGPAYGFAGRLREAFDKAEATSDKAIPKGTKQSLIGLKVLTPPKPKKKNPIERILRM
jgi:hypothetical protein